MLRPSTLLSLAVLTPLVVLAAPVPESISHDKAFKRAFGTRHTPDGSTLRFDGTTLIARVPKATWVGSQHDPLTGPHTEQGVTGDFEMTVVVRTTAPADPPQGKKGGTRCDIGGGLAVWEPDAKDPTQAAKDARDRRKSASVCRFYNHKGEPRRGEERMWFPTDCVSVPGSFGVDEGERGDPTAPTHLRLTRTGDRFQMFVSDDGETWKRSEDCDVELPDRVSVGVWAFEGTSRGYEVTFEKFTVKQQ